MLVVHQRKSIGLGGGDPGGLGGSMPRCGRGPWRMCRCSRRRTSSVGVGVTLGVGVAVGVPVRVTGGVALVLRSAWVQDPKA